MKENKGIYRLTKDVKILSLSRLPEMLLKDFKYIFFFQAGRGMRNDTFATQPANPWLNHFFNFKRGEVN